MKSSGKEPPSCPGTKPTQGNVKKFSWGTKGGSTKARRKQRKEGETEILPFTFSRQKYPVKFLSKKSDFPSGYEYQRIVRSKLYAAHPSDRQGGASDDQVRHGS